MMMYRYFRQAFLGAAGFHGDGATLQVSHHDSVHTMDTVPSMSSLPSQLYEDATGEDTVPVHTNEIVRGARVTFKESAHVLQRIVEFMYLGEIGDLEKGSSTASEDDYNLWMWLLTWCCTTLRLFIATQVQI